MMTYKFRLYPKKDQEAKLLKTLEICRETYNYFLSEIRKRNKVPSRLELQSQLPRLKKEKSELNKVYSKVLQMILYQLYSNLKALAKLKQNGKKVGKLRYKGKWFKTFVYNQSGFKIMKTGKRLDLLHLSKIGDIPIRIHRKIKGRVKQIIVKRYPSGEWFALVCVENEKADEQRKTGKAIGIDVGIKYFLTDSEGRQIENPRFYERTLERIKIEQRRLSKKKKGSKNYEKQRKKLVKYYEKLTNQRDDFLHKLSRYYVDNYDFIVVEDLNIRNMVRNHRLAQKILDSSWAKFFQLLQYKAENAGAVVLKVNPRGTSKGLSYKNNLRDFISANRILMRGWDSPDSLLERRPLLRTISYKEIVSGQVFSMKQEAPCVSWE